MLVESVAFFLAVSILFYCLFAGADFGAGILEAFLGNTRRDEQRTVITHAIGPVWEANLMARSGGGYSLYRFSESL
jgi:cytochrome bd ubiquinol oxidase subunit II